MLVADHKRNVERESIGNLLEFAAVLSSVFRQLALPDLRLVSRLERTSLLAKPVVRTWNRT